MREYNATLVMGAFAVNTVCESELLLEDCHSLKIGAGLVCRRRVAVSARGPTPNILTLFRIATAPLLVCLLTFTGPVPSAIAAAIFFLATISDIFDGYIARNYGSGTALGKFLDPIADKLVVTSVLIMLCAIRGYRTCRAGSSRCWSRANSW